MKHALSLGRIAGVRVYIHWTFSLLIGWIVIANARAGLDASSIVWTIALTLAAFACVVLHELGHAAAAHRFNVKTRAIVVYPVGGIAEMESIPENPRHELIIALAGPLVNFIIAGILFPVVNINSFIGLNSVAALGPKNFIFFLATINVWLGVFNLIPAFPMDGGRVLRALLAMRVDRARATRMATRIGQAFAAVFVVAGIFYAPMLMVIGLFIFISGQYESAMVTVTHLLARYRVYDVLMRDIPFIDNGYSIEEASRVLLNTQHKIFVVTEHGKPVGTISREAIIQTVQTGGHKAVAEVKDPDVIYVSEQTPLDEAWKTMQQSKKQIMLVGSFGQLTGIVDEENIAEFVQLHAPEQSA